MINSQKLKDRAKSLGVRQNAIAEYLGLKQSSVNLKINNVRPMYLGEAEKIAELLQISDSDFGEYFFTREVAQCNISEREKDDYRETAC